MRNKKYLIFCFFAIFLSVSLKFSYSMEAKNKEELGLYFFEDTFSIKFPEKDFKGALCKKMGSLLEDRKPKVLVKFGEFDGLHWELRRDIFSSIDLEKIEEVWNFVVSNKKRDAAFWGRLLQESQRKKRVHFSFFKKQWESSSDMVTFIKKMKINNPFKEKKLSVLKLMSSLFQLNASLQVIQLKGRNIFSPENAWDNFINIFLPLSFQRLRVKTSIVSGNFPLFFKILKQASSLKALQILVKEADFDRVFLEKSKKKLPRESSTSLSLKRSFTLELQGEWISEDLLKKEKGEEGRAHILEKILKTFSFSKICIQTSKLTSEDVKALEDLLEKHSSLEWILLKKSLEASC